MDKTYSTNSIYHWQVGDICVCHPTHPSELLRDPEADKKFEDWVADKPQWQIKEDNTMQQIEEVLIRWENKRFTFRILSVDDYGLFSSDRGMTVQVLWSNMRAIASPGDKLKLIFDGKKAKDRIPLTETLHLPTADNSGNVARIFRTRRPGEPGTSGQPGNSYSKEYNEYAEPNSRWLPQCVPQRQELDDKGNILKAYWPKTWGLTTDRGKALSDYFDNNWTIKLRAEGKFINYIQKLGMKYMGKVANSFQENGFFVPALQTDDQMNDDYDLTCRNNVDCVFDRYESLGDNDRINYCYFPFSGISGASASELKLGVPLSSSSPNVSQIVCLRWHCMKDFNEELPISDCVYVFTADKNILEGPNPGITLYRQGNSDLVATDDDGKTIKAPRAYYEFFHRGINKYMLHKENTELMQEWLQAKAVAIDDDKSYYYNKNTSAPDALGTPNRLRQTMWPEYRATFGTTKWHATFFVQHTRIQSKVILPDKTITKHIFFPDKTMLPARRMQHRNWSSGLPGVVYAKLFFSIFTKGFPFSVWPALEIEEAIEYAIRNEARDLVDDKLTANELDALQLGYNSSTVLSRRAIDALLGVLMAKLQAMVEDESAQYDRQVRVFESWVDEYVNESDDFLREILTFGLKATMDPLPVINYLEMHKKIANSEIGNQYFGLGGISGKNSLGSCRMLFFRSLRKVDEVNAEFDPDSKYIKLRGMADSLRKAGNGELELIMNFTDLGRKDIEPLKAVEDSTRYLTVTLDSTKETTLNEDIHVELTSRKAAIKRFNDMSEHITFRDMSVAIWETGFSITGVRLKDKWNGFKTDRGLTLEDSNIPIQIATDFVEQIILKKVEIHPDESISSFLLHVVGRDFGSNLGDRSFDIDALEQLQEKVYGIEIFFTDEDFNEKINSYRNNAIVIGGINIPMSANEGYQRRLRPTIVIRTLTREYCQNTTITQFLNEQYGLTGFMEREKLPGDWDREISISIILEREERVSSEIDISVEFPRGKWKSPVKQLNMVWDSQLPKSNIPSLADESFGTRYNAKDTGSATQAWMYKGGRYVVPPSNADATYRSTLGPGNIDFSALSYADRTIFYMPQPSLINAVNNEPNSAATVLSFQNLANIRRFREEKMIELYIQASKKLDMTKDVMVDIIPSENKRKLIDLRDWAESITPDMTRIVQSVKQSEKTWKEQGVAPQEIDGRVQSLFNGMPPPPGYLPESDIMMDKPIKPLFGLSTDHIRKEVKLPGYGKVGDALTHLYHSRLNRALQAINGLFSTLKPQSQYTVIRNFLTKRLEHAAISKEQKKIILGKLKTRGWPGFKLSKKERENIRKKAEESMPAGESFKIVENYTLLPGATIRNSIFFMEPVDEWVSLYNTYLHPNHNFTRADLFQTGILNTLETIIKKKNSYLRAQVSGYIKKGELPPPQISAIMPVPSVVKLITDVYNVALKGNVRFNVGGAVIPLNLMSEFMYIKQLFSKITLHTQHFPEIILYSDGQIITNALYKAGVKIGGSSKTDLSKQKLSIVFHTNHIDDDYEFRLDNSIDSVLKNEGSNRFRNGYHKLNMAQRGSIFTEPKDILTRDDKWNENISLITKPMSDLLVKASNLNKDRVIERWMMQEEDLVPDLDEDGRQKKSEDGKPLWKMEPIDKQKEYKFYGKLKKIEYLSELLVEASEDSQMEAKSEFISQYMSGTRKFSKELIEDALGYENNTCVICGKRGANVKFSRCSRPGDAHCAHLSCIYHNTVVDTGKKRKSEKYYAINLDQCMLYRTDMNYEILKDDNMTVRQFLINRQIYKGGGPRRLEHILPGRQEEAVKCDAGGNRYYFLPLGRASVEGFASEDHENGVGAWQNIQSFRNDEMMSGINDATGRYIAEDGSENFHGILHAWTTAATCQRCTSKYGSKLIFSTPICENNKYRGRHIREYDNSANFPGPVAPNGNRPVLSNDFFQQYKHKYMLFRYEPTGRAEEGDDDDFGSGSMELFTGLDKYMANYNGDLVSSTPRNEPEIYLSKIVIPDVEDVVIDDAKYRRTDDVEQPNGYTVGDRGWEEELKAIEALGGRKSYPIESQELNLFGNIDDIDKWIGMAEQSIAKIAETNRRETQEEKELAIQNKLRRYNVNRLQDIPRRWVTRFVPVGGGMVKPLNLPHDITVSKFIEEIENNYNGPIENRFLNVIFPVGYQAGDMIKKSEHIACWPEEVSLNNLVGKPRDAQGRLAEEYVMKIPIYQEDKEPKNDEEKAQAEKSKRALQSKILTKIEYMGRTVTRWNSVEQKNEAAGYHTVWTVGKFYSERLSMRCQPPTAIGWHGTKPPFDALQYPNISKTEQFMLRFKPKDQYRDINNFKVLLEFIDEETGSVIEVNKAPMVVDCNINDEIEMFGMRIQQCAWYRKVSNWKHMIKVGEDGDREDVYCPALPDKRRLFKEYFSITSDSYMKPQSSGMVFPQLYKTRTVRIITGKGRIMDDYLDCEDFEYDTGHQNDYQAMHSGSWKDFLLNVDAILKDDEEEDDENAEWMVKHDTMEEPDGLYGIPNPWNMTCNAEYFGNHKAFFDVGATKRYIKMQISIPKQSRFAGTVQSCDHYQDVKRLFDDVKDSRLVIAHVKFRNKQYNSYHYDEEGDEERIPIPIPKSLFAYYSDSWTKTKVIEGLRRWGSMFETKEAGTLFASERLMPYGAKYTEGFRNIDDLYEWKRINDYWLKFQIFNPDSGYELRAITAKLVDGDGKQHNPGKYADAGLRPSVFKVDASNKHQVIYVDRALQRRTMATVIPKKILKGNEKPSELYFEGHELEPGKKLIPHIGMLDNENIKWNVVQPIDLLQRGIKIQYSGDIHSQDRFEYYNELKKWMQVDMKVGMIGRSEWGELNRDNIAEHEVMNSRWSQTGVIGRMNEEDQQICEGIERAQGTDAILNEIEMAANYGGRSGFLCQDSEMKYFEENGRLEIDIFRQLPFYPKDDDDYYMPPASAKPILFTFLDCTHAEDNLSRFQKSFFSTLLQSNRHEYFLPEYLPDYDTHIETVRRKEEADIFEQIKGDAPPGKQYGFKDREWPQMFQDLINVYIAEIVYSIDEPVGGNKVVWPEEWRDKDKAPLYDIRVKGEDGEWTRIDYETRMNDPQKVIDILAKNAQYMGTKIIRKHRTYNSVSGHGFNNTHVSNRWQWAHLPSIPDKLTSELKLMASVENYHNGDQDEGFDMRFLSILDTDKVNPGEKFSFEDVRKPEQSLNWKVHNHPIDFNSFMIDTPQWEEGIGGNIIGSTTNNGMPIIESYMFRYAKENNLANLNDAEKESGNPVSYLDPTRWQQTGENKIYLNRTMGVDENLLRGISRDGQGYNIQRALFGMHGTMDANTNPWEDPVSSYGDIPKPNDLTRPTAPEFQIGVSFGDNVHIFKNGIYKDRILDYAKQRKGQHNRFYGDNADPDADWDERHKKMFVGDIVVNENIIYVVRHVNKNRNGEYDGEVDLMELPKEWEGDIKGWFEKSIDPPSLNRVEGREIKFVSRGIRYKKSWQNGEIHILGDGDFDPEDQSYWLKPGDYAHFDDPNEPRIRDRVIIWFAHPKLNVVYVQEENSELNGKKNVFAVSPDTIVRYANQTDRIFGPDETDSSDAGIESDAADAGSDTQRESDYSSSDAGDGTVTEDLFKKLNLRF